MKTPFLRLEAYLGPVRGSRPKVQQQLAFGQNGGWYVEMSAEIFIVGLDKAKPVIRILEMPLDQKVIPALFVALAFKQNLKTVTVLGDLYTIGDKLEHGPLGAVQRYY